ncbi:MAG: long chain fatty acid transport protein [Zetaproteobacteria bacterium CG_4_9_14_3_um_filter_49_83]|nr:MAG: hypothetical protein AUJ56_00435 [Zetaproteobacteria bacterium CG1_02_49_23]PIQ31541.1 MAG: long chain fatty acid transport protein [Zetaproteobacteria bacterium CG17_big_fil_post_rev_8_21_14_2_50_50_13]PIV31097.1 MAG: long chain fatty acid transport protein [Zetaproteobacteria bacterium CG02_land_8_20_14_3_00_50_9]PIY54579.1 MAG: long chain fatty acid transport protein [Zetaproteobacteria bacterium CG_4_10_14_0_8_um_filter_49_80]PJA35692.1 MAG: long chain fatty acid transport protein [
MRLYKAIGLLTLATLGSANAGASGFMIPEQGTKAMSMGNAFAAVADDPSANWFNPAGLAFQSNGVMASGDIILPTNKFTDPATGKSYTAEKKVFVLPLAYVNYHIEDTKFTLGLGVNSPFGLSTNWGNSGAPFSQVMAGSKSVTFSQIEGVHINPNVVYQFNDNLSVAAGLAYYNLTKVHLDSQALKIGGHGNGLGSNAALMYKNGGLGIGISYRSSVSVDVNGTAVGGPALSIFGLTGVAGKVKTSVKMPAIISVGVSYRIEDWLLSLQADQVDWSSFNQIDLSFAPSALNLVTTSNSTIKEGWKKTTAYRLGVEWAMSENDDIRFGYVTDPTPTNSVDLSPRLPGNDRQLLGLGYGTKLADNIQLDFSYAYVWLKDRNLTTAATTVYNGFYKSTVHMFSGGLVYRF